MLNLRARAGWLAHVLKASTQQHHLELESVFAPYIDRAAVVFDVGAHAGQFSKLFANMAPDGRVFAFEPSVYARSVLKPALKWSGLNNVEIVPTGLSDVPGSLTLTTPIKRRGGVGFGLASLGGAGGGGPVLQQTVELTTLDGFFADRALKRLDFIKADVEGWEAHVLRGGLKTLAEHRPTLFLEVVETSLARAGSSPNQIWDMLAPLGYVALMAPGFEPVPDLGRPGDYLFTASGPGR